MLQALKRWFGGPNEVIDAQWLEEHPTFCLIPWVHFHVTQTGAVAPCCQAPWDGAPLGNVNTDSVEAIWNAAPMREFRRNMLKGKEDERCKACYAKEKAGFRSLRNVTNMDYAGHLDRVQATGSKGQLDAHRPIYLDIRFSNICNFKCRICGPWASSQWHNDAVSLGLKEANSPAIDRSIDQPQDFWPQINQLVPELQEIYFAGGEPLIMEEHYQLLEMLHRQQKFDVTLKYSTNLSTLRFKDWEVLELWKPFRKVIIAASLDGSGNRGAYQRKNQKWTEVVAVRTRLQELGDRLQFLVSPTVNMFNVLHLPDFHREWVAEGWVEPFEFIPSLLQSPAHYDIAHLPPTFKEKAQAKIESHIQWLVQFEAQDPRQKPFVMAQWQGCLGRMQLPADPEQLKRFAEQTQKLDQLRQESFSETFPEWQGLFDGLSEK